MRAKHYTLLFGCTAAIVLVVGYLGRADRPGLLRRFPPKPGWYVIVFAPPAAPGSSEATTETVDFAAAQSDIVKVGFPASYGWSTKDRYVVRGDAGDQSLQELGWAVFGEATGSLQAHDRSICEYLAAYIGPSPPDAGFEQQRLREFLRERAAHPHGPGTTSTDDAH